MRFWADKEKKFKQLINVVRDERPKSKESLELHTHDFVEIEYVIQGSGIQEINGVKYSVKRGDLICLKKGDFHTYYTDNKIEVLNVDFYYSVFDEMRDILSVYSGGKEIDFPTIMHIQGSDLLYIEELLLKAEREFNEEKIGYYHVLKSYLSILLIYLWRITLDEQKGKNYKFPAIVEYIDRNFAHVKIQDIAEEFGYSANYFSKLFRRNMGMSFIEYVNHKRLNKAILLLTTTDRTIEDICVEIGLSDKKHFYEIFKRYLGTTPGDIRKHKGSTL